MKKAIVVSCCLVMLAGCATQPNSGRVYRAGEAGREHMIRMGTVESVRSVVIDKGQNGVGTFAGGALGGLAAGRNVGSGTGAVAAGIVGALAGGIAGQHVENNVTRRPGTEITVRFDDGSLRAIVQDADEPFRVGERVRMVSSGRTTRVTH